jgi:Tfp pilus assembly protein PilF
MHYRILAALSSLLLAAPLVAQKPDKAAHRLDALRAAPPPALEAGADTNDFVSYVTRGRALMRSRRPAEAAVAFLWAARLSPAVPEPSMLAWKAIWAANPDALRKHARGDRRFAASGAGLRVDSLYVRGMERNPFATPDDEELRTLQPFLLASARQAIARDSDAVSPRVFLAITYFREGNYRNAITVLQDVLRALDRRQADHTRPVYESREIVHYALGHAYSVDGNRAEARESYRRALEENAGFYQAHARLGLLAWDGQRDTATALLEYQSAVGTAPHDAALRNDFGAILLEMGRPAEALEQFEAGMQLDPDYSLLYYNAGMAADKLGDRERTTRHYREFVRRAPRRLRESVTAAEERIAALAVQ